MQTHSPRSIALTALAFTLFALNSASSLLADTVMLKDGDKLTGTAVKLDSGKLTFKPTYSDPIAIAWDNVTSLTTDKPMVLPTAKGNLSVTGIERSSSGIVVTTSTGPTTLDPKDVTILRSPADQAAYEASLHPNWVHGWTGAANVSYALARGNSSTSTFGAGVTAARPTLTDKTALYVNTLYSTNGNATPSTSANATGGGIRYDHNLNPKFFGFVTGDFYSDALQELDLRSIIGGGAGYHVIATPKQTLDVLAGVVWTHESYSATAAAASTTNSFPALDLGEQYTRKVGAGSILTEQFSIYPDLSDTSQYQFVLNAGFSTKLGKILSWASTLNDNYTSFPPAGTLSNDVIFTTGLGITLTH